MKRKTIKPIAHLFSTTLAGYEPKQFNEYLNKVEKELKKYAKQLNCTISCHVEYIPLNYNEVINGADKIYKLRDKDLNFVNKKKVNYKKIDKMFKFPELKVGISKEYKNKA